MVRLDIPLVDWSSKRMVVTQDASVDFDALERTISKIVRYVGWAGEVAEVWKEYALWFCRQI